MTRRGLPRVHRVGVVVGPLAVCFGLAEPELDCHQDRLVPLTAETLVEAVRVLAPVPVGAPAP